ncbi:MAG: alpha/beta hydrolase [Bacteroidota bacterium]
MKVLRKILKWTGISITFLLLLILLAGLSFRLFSPSPHLPQGELINVGDFQLHINVSGEQKEGQATVVIEAGAGLSTEYYHWLHEGLKDSLRVVRYDRAGLGHSDASSTPRDPATIAKELHTLLENAGETPPYILAGHSLGGAYIRLFAELYPEEVASLVFLDATHPEQVERLHAPTATSFKYRSYVFLLGAFAILGDVGVLGSYDRMSGHILTQDGLPKTANDRITDFLLNGQYVRGFRKEIQSYHSTLERVADMKYLGDLPIRVFTATVIHKESYRARGIDPEEHLANKIAAQREFTDLSTNGKQILMEGNHSNIFTDQEHAEVICAEILKVVDELE